MNLSRFRPNSHPRLSRIAHLARSAGTPIAASTWLGATLPDEQADPDDTATPAKSIAITRVSAGTPGIARQRVWGKRATPALNTVARGPTMSASRSRQPAHNAALSRSARAASAAAPKPAMAATFSVPARVRRSCPPPVSSGAKVTSSLARTMAPAPCGPPILWADRVSTSTPSALISTGKRPAAWIASQWTIAPASWAIRATSATG